MQERLQKILAASGVASRRKAEELILSGAVLVNGHKVTTLGTKADTDNDTIIVSGKPLTSPERVVYALYKPVGVISTRSDEQNRTSVVDLVPPEPPVYPVGRLDRQSEGLILLTNMGDLTDRLTHPRYGHRKEYELTGTTHLAIDELLARLARGAQLTDGFVKPDEVNFLGVRDKQLVFRLVVHEGKNHVLRRLAAKLDFEITRLKRVRIGPIELATLEPGKWRKLTVEELAKLNSD